MQINAELNYLRMSPRKVRLAADTIRGKRVPEAERALRFLTRRASSPLEKLLRSAVASAKHDFHVPSADSLVVSEISVGGGPTLKRRRPRARGLAFPIAKRTSHVRLVLETIAEVPARLGRRKAPIEIQYAEAGADLHEAVRAEAPKILPERKAWHIKPKVATKPRSFIQRMFRRKAI